MTERNSDSVCEKCNDTECEFLFDFEICCVCYAKMQEKWCVQCQIRINNSENVIKNDKQ